MELKYEGVSREQKAQELSKVFETLSRGPDHSAVMGKTMSLITDATATLERLIG